MIGQQGVAWTQGDVERMVAVGGGHDVGSSVVIQAPHGWRVWADVRGHGCYGGGRLLKRGPTMDLSGHLHLAHAAVMGRAGRPRGSICLSLPLSFFLSFAFLSSAELSLSPQPFHSLLPFFGQLGGRQWSKEKVRPRTGVVATIQVFYKPCRLTCMACHVDNSRLW